MLDTVRCIIALLRIIVIGIKPEQIIGTVMPRPDLTNIDDAQIVQAAGLTKTCHQLYFERSCRHCRRYPVVFLRTLVEH